MNSLPDNQREIKFRGKDIKTGEWVYGAYASDGMRKVILVRNSFEEDRIYDGHFSTECHEYEVHPKTVGQLTGLKDKNGVEIYEGDVLSIYIGDILQANFFHVEDLRMFYERIDCSDNYYRIDERTMEIRGNIYETPNLLK